MARASNPWVLGQRKRGSVKEFILTASQYPLFQFYVFHFDTASSPEISLYLLARAFCSFSTFARLSPRVVGYLSYAAYVSRRLFAQYVLIRSFRATRIS